MSDKKVKVGLVHGRLKKEQKDKIINRFRKGVVQLLVCTTVIEVGVDVPEATLMIIENPERLGLAQLHQLRGRIGRGTAQSYCILVQHSQTVDSIHRLKVMESTSNGFKISDEDLKLRGPGEFFGTKQHGYIKSNIANFIEDGPIIRQTRNRAFEMVMTDPKLQFKEHEKIRTQFKENYRHMLEFINIS